MMLYGKTLYKKQAMLRLDITIQSAIFSIDHLSCVALQYVSLSGVIIWLYWWKLSYHIFIVNKLLKIPIFLEIYIIHFLKELALF